jgi:hypothetical protein
VRCIREAQDARRDYSAILQAASATQTGCLPHWVSLILKLGRYGVASRAMVQLVLEFPSLFNPMVVEAIPAPPKVPFVAEGPGLESVLRRAVAGREAEYTSRLARIWGSEDPEAQFRAACPSTLTVHAEIQLACFYDRNPEYRPFRFIGVSKKSCYLCYKFLALHLGSFNVSSCHQKLYLSWKFPPTDTRQVRSRYNSISREISQVMEGAVQKDLQQRLGTARRPVPADSSAGISLTGLTEHSAENGLPSGVVGRCGKRLKRKVSATTTFLGGARLYPSSVGKMQSKDVGTSQSTATNFEPSAPISEIVILFTRAGDPARQDIIQVGDILDQCTQLPSWAKLVDILKAGGKFGLAFKEESEYIIINGQINVHEERQFLACLQYLRNANRLNAEAAVCSAEAS